MILRQVESTMRFGDLKALLAGTISHAPKRLVFKEEMSVTMDTFGIQNSAHLHPFGEEKADFINNNNSCRLCV